MHLDAIASYYWYDTETKYKNTIILKEKNPSLISWCIFVTCESQKKTSFLKWESLLVRIPLSLFRVRLLLRHGTCEMSLGMDCKRDGRLNSILGLEKSECTTRNLGLGDVLKTSLKTQKNHYRHKWSIATFSFATLKTSQ